MAMFYVWPALVIASTFLIMFVFRKLPISKGAAMAVAAFGLIEFIVCVAAVIIFEQADISLAVVSESPNSRMLAFSALGLGMMIAGLALLAKTAITRKQHASERAEHGSAPR